MDGILAIESSDKAKWANNSVQIFILAFILKKKSLELKLNNALQSDE